MKKILLICLLLMSVGAIAKTISRSKVPAAVKTAFKKNFPDVKDEKWEMEKKNFEANFKVKDIETSVVFNTKGDWLETETAIKQSELPGNVQTYIAGKSGKVRESAVIKKANGETVYEVQIKKGVDMLFDDKGNFIKEVKD